MTQTADGRGRARQLAAESVARGEPTGWFEQLYREAGDGRAVVPWADGKPNPHLVNRFRGRSIPPTSALVVGCGLGDDAEWLAERGFGVTAFDISPSAIDQAHRRFPSSAVDYDVADILDIPSRWEGAFGFVFEAYTLQVLPPETRRLAITQIARTVGSGGVLLVVCRGRGEADPTGDMPWPLLRGELDGFTSTGLREISCEDYLDDYLDDESPPVRRFRALYRRGA